MSLCRVLLLPLSLLLGCAALTLPPNRPLARPVAFRGAYEEFPSGLRLVVHEDASAPQVTMNVSYLAGATDEPEGKEGLAHLVEHLTFRARPGGERAPRLSRRLLASGAEFNAVTSYDGTDYFFTAPPEQFPLLAALEAERLREPLAHVTEEDFPSTCGASARACCSWCRSRPAPDAPWSPSASRPSRARRTSETRS